MRVILETSRVGRGFAQYPGDEIDLPDGEAKALIDSGAAMAAPVETAMRDRNVKTAATRRTKRN